MVNGFEINMTPIQKALQDQEIEQLYPVLQDRVKLIKALSRKYGKDFNSVPTARNALKHFDNERDMIQNMFKAGRK